MVSPEDQKDIVKAFGKLTFPKPSHFYKPCYTMAKSKLHDVGEDSQIKKKQDMIKDDYSASKSASDIFFF